MLDPSTLNPVMAPARDVVFLKNIITSPNIEVGDYTYYHDFNGPERFQTHNVLFPFLAKLKIGKFCQIGQGTTFILNSANHQMNGFSTYPFFIFGQEYRNYPVDLPYKGDNIVGNDVWFGHNSVVMPGIKIGDGAIIGAYAVVTKDVEPYTIVGGNPAKVIRKRFDEATIKGLQEIAWWDWPIEKISQFIPQITGGNLEALYKASLG